jgi:hypothetical protein
VEHARATERRAQDLRALVRDAPQTAVAGSGVSVNIARIGTREAPSPAADGLAALAASLLERPGVDVELASR